MERRDPVEQEFEALEREHPSIFRRKKFERWHDYEDAQQEARLAVWLHLKANGRRDLRLLHSIAVRAFYTLFRDSRTGVVYGPRLRRARATGATHPERRGLVVADEGVEDRELRRVDEREFIEETFSRVDVNVPRPNGRLLRYEMRLRKKERLLEEKHREKLRRLQMAEDARKARTDGPEKDPDFEPKTLAAVEREHIERTLRYCNGVVTKAALLLDIGRSTLYRKLDDYRAEEVRRG